MNKNRVFNFFAQSKRPKVIIVAILLIIVLRIAFIGLMGLMPQDAYYYFYSRHIALSYYDHPPAIAYLLWLFTTVLGKKAFVIKLTDSVITLLSVLSFYKLANCFLSTQRSCNAVLLFFSTFLVTILSLVSTPDVPLILFWSLSLISLYHAVFLQKKTYWLLSGLLMGLAFDSKYTAIFLPFGIVLFLLLSAKYRKQLISPWFLFSGLLFLVTISPVIIWNAQNGFASFKFQSSSRVQSMGGTHINPQFFLGTIAHQMAILLPILFIALVYFLFKLAKRYKLRILKIDPEQLFLLCFFLPLFLGFFGISLVYWVKVNWMMPAYITAIIWVSIYIGKKWVRWQLIVSAIVHLMLAVEVLFYPVLVRSDDTWEGWQQLAQKISVLKNAYPNDFVFSADDYKTSAMLGFYYGDSDMIYAQNVIGRPALQFDYIGTDLHKLNGKDALFIDSDPGFNNEAKKNNYPPGLSSYFDSVTELDPVLIKEGNRTVRKFFVYACKNYHNP